MGRGREGGGVLTWGEFGRRWRAYLVAGGRAEGTVTVYVGSLRRFAAWCRPRGLEPADVRAEHLVEWAGSMSWSPATRNLYRAALRGAWGWAVGAGVLEHDPTGGLPGVRKRPPKPHPTPEHAYASALRAAKPRERLMLRLAAEAGMRRAEVARASRHDLVEDLVGWSLWVHGKGDKDRLVPLTDSLARELRLACDAATGWAFPNRAGGHLKPGYVGSLISAALPPGYTMHSLRHRFATMAHRLSGGDVFAVQSLLGHASPETTLMYVQLDEDVARGIVELVGNIDAPGQRAPAEAMRRRDVARRRGAGGRLRGVG